MTKLPLISIGIPTYNRPGGLKDLLNCVLAQKRDDFEVIISNNASPDPMVDEVINEFISKDSRIRYYRQAVNNGVLFNFKFVLEKAVGDYFIWAADDDLWRGTDFLGTLLIHAASHALVFPDALVKRKNSGFDHPLSEYKNCVSRLDYSRVLCSNGAGHPIYGLFNLRILHELGIDFIFDDDLSYYNEGTYLHRLFLSAPVKYVEEAKILYSYSYAKASSQKQLDDFFKYFNRVILIYMQANLDENLKKELVNSIFQNYEGHIKELASAIESEKMNQKKPLQIRVRRAIKMLLKG